MTHDAGDRLIELQTRTRLARDLAGVLSASRTEHGWPSDGLIDECLDRLCRQIDLLGLLAANMGQNDPVRHVSVAAHDPLRMHDLLPAGPHD